MNVLWSTRRIRMGTLRALSGGCSHTPCSDSYCYSRRSVFRIVIAEKQWTLRCRPADRAVGYLHAATRPGSDVLDGRFLVELARCEDAKTGKILDTEAGGSPGQAWPSQPLTLRGSFQGLPKGQTNAESVIRN